MKYLIVIFFILTSNAFCQNSSWQKVFEQDGIKILAKKKENGIIPFKAITTIDASLNEVIATLKDHKSKHLWSPKLKYVKVHNQLSENEYFFSEFYKTPWPSTDREFLLKGKITQKNKIYFLEAHSIKNDLLINSQYIQANIKKLLIVLEQKDPHKTKMSFEFHGDMKGWLPLWLVNIIQKKWPYAFIIALKNRIYLRAKVAMISSR